MNNKKNIGLYVLVVILLFIIVGLGIFILYDKVLSKNSQNEQNRINEIGNIINNQISQNPNDYILLETTTIGTNNLQVDKVSFKNIDSSLTSKFLNDQTKLYQKLNQSTKAKSNVLYEINNDILTVHYEMTADLAIDDDCKEIITTNIDLRNNKVLSNKEVLQLVNLTFEELAEKEYNRKLEATKEMNFVILDKDTAQMITKEQYIEKKDEITNNIINGLEDVIYTYIQNNTVKYDYVVLGIEMLYSNPGKGGCFPYKTEIVGKINK